MKQYISHTRHWAKGCVPLSMYLRHFVRSIIFAFPSFITYITFSSFSGATPLPVDDSGFSAAFTGQTIMQFPHPMQLFSSRIIPVSKASLRGIRSSWSFFNCFSYAFSSKRGVHFSSSVWRPMTLTAKAIHPDSSHFLQLV